MFFTNPQIISPNFFDGMREAVVKYAVWKDGTQLVGCGIYTLKQALDEIDQLEKKWKKDNNKDIW